MASYDLVIKKGKIMDPASECSGIYNIGILDGKITTLTSNDIEGKDEINADGLIVSPGFIDIHTHADGNVTRGEILVKMGVTSTIGGNCGAFAWFDDDYFKKLEETKNYTMVTNNQVEKDWEDLFKVIDNEGYPVNLGMFVGAHALRVRLGIEGLFSPADKTQIAKMSTMLKRAMKKGAFGVSYGLSYAPGVSQEELTALFEVAAQFDGFASIHPRGSALGIPGMMPDGLQGHKELIDIARHTRVKLQLSHLGGQLAFKGKTYYDLVYRGMKMIEDARAEGIDVMADCAVFSGFGVSLKTAFVQMAYKMVSLVEHTYGMKIDRAFRISDGKYLGQGLTPELYQVLKKEAPNTLLTGHIQQDDLIIETLVPPYVMISSDSVGNLIPSQAIVLGKYVREKPVLSLMEALNKASTLPAKRLGLKSKGKIAVGCDADFTIFNPDTIDGEFNIRGPSSIQGIQHVIVNGVPVLRDELLTHKTPGKAIRHVPWE